MKVPAVVLTMVLGAAPMFAQALIEYGGAMSPAGTFAGQPANPALRIHHKEIMAETNASHRKPMQATKAGHRDGKMAHEIGPREQAPSAQDKPVTTKKISDNGGITIQR